MNHKALGTRPNNEIEGCFSLYSTRYRDVSSELVGRRPAFGQKRQTTAWPPFSDRRKFG